jgi:protein transport protein HofB
MPCQPGLLESQNITILMDQLLEYCLQHQISDLHFEPLAHDFRLRVRIEGSLQNHSLFTPTIYKTMAQRFKALAHLNITEQKSPQDGQWLWQHQQRKQSIPCRLSTCPVLYGEKLVVRLLKHPFYHASWSNLGMSSHQAQIFEKHLNYQQGLILVNGPTGSGKTTTLYQALQYLNHDALNIVSIEDPIEIPFSKINQIEILPQLGFTLAKTLRTVLRQDPDVILIGEIRDFETAKLAIEAAQTGHLILSSLHSPDCLSSLQRLKNLGIAEEDIQEHVHLIIAQKLIPKCQGGRIGIFEFLELDHSCPTVQSSFQEQLFHLYEQNIISYEQILHD